MEKSHYLQLLGPVQIEWTEPPPHNFESRKALALLCYLAVQRQPISRSFLVNLFWRDKTESRGRGNLSRVLHNISTLLPGSLAADRHTVQFQPTELLRLDIDAFEAYVAREDVDSLAAAAALYQGEFMAGFYLDSAPDFETWLTTERMHWSQRIALALQNLVAYHTQRQAYDQGLAFAHQLLTFEPWREEVHRQVMELLAFSGQRGAALAQYNLCCHILDEELNVEPAEETVLLYERIRRGEVGREERTRYGKDSRPQKRALITAPSTFLTSASQAGNREAPFVAREPELQQLHHFLNLAQARQGRVVLITGEAGSGKSALIQEFTRLAQQQMATLIVVGGTCNAYRGIGTPYLPFRQILELLTGDTEINQNNEPFSQVTTDRLLNLRSLSIQALVKAGPDLIDIFVPGAALLSRAVRVAPNEPDWLRQLELLVARKQSESDLSNLKQHDLFEQYARVLQIVAQDHPLLLVLDDLQWAGAGSTSLLFHLGRRLANSPVLIVGAYRPADVAIGHSPSQKASEPGERHPLAAVVNEFQRLFGRIFINLDRAQGRAFVEAFLDIEPNQLSLEFREALYRHTRGQPLFTVETLRAMQARGDLVQDETGRWVEGSTIRWTRMSARVEGVIGERIGRLPAALRDVLKVASVEGEVFTAEVVAQVQGLEPKKVIRQLSSVLDQQHRLVQSRKSQSVAGQRLSSYRFRHILFQQYLYDSLDEAERVYLHEAVGRALEQLYSGQLEEMTGELARHFQAADLTTQAVNYLHRAGRRAVRLFANEEAVAYFTQALSLLDTLSDTPDRRQQELTLQLALSTPLVMLKGYAAPEVEAVYTRAWTLCQQFGEPPELAPVLRGLWDCYLVRAEHRRAYELAEQLFSLAQRKQEPILLMEGHWAMGETLYSLGELLQAQEHQEETITLYNLDAYQAYGFRAVQDPGLSSRYFNAVTLWLLGYPDSALKQIKDTLALAQELSYPFDLASTFFFAGILHQFRREPKGVQARAEAVLALAEKYGFTLLFSWGAMLRGWALTQQEQGEVGVEQLHRGLAAFQATGAGAGQPHYLALLAEAYRQVGQPKKGLRTLDEALTAVEKSGERWWEAELYRLKGELLLESSNGDSLHSDAADEIEACFGRALQIAHRQRARSLELRAALSLYRWRQTLKIRDRYQESRQTLAEVYSWFTEGFNTADLQEAKMLLGTSD